MFDPVQDLLFRAEFFIKAHTRLRSTFLEKMPADAAAQTEYFDLPLTNLSVLNANLYLFEAVSCLASLLRESRNDPTKDEISFAHLTEKLADTAKQSFQSRLKAVFEEYRNSGLEDMRNKYVDHKDLKLSGDPTAAFINLPEGILVDSCSKLIDELGRLYQDYFPGRVTNNYFSDYYSNAIEKHVELLSQT